MYDVYQGCLDDIHTHFEDTYIVRPACLCCRVGLDGQQNSSYSSLTNPMPKATCSAIIRQKLRRYNTETHRRHNDLELMLLPSLLNIPPVPFAHPSMIMLSSQTVILP